MLRTRVAAAAAAAQCDWQRENGPLHSSARTPIEGRRRLMWCRASRVCLLLNGKETHLPRPCSMDLFRLFSLHLSSFYAAVDSVTVGRTCGSICVRLGLVALLERACLLGCRCRRTTAAAAAAAREREDAGLCPPSSGLCSRPVVGAPCRGERDADSIPAARPCRSLWAPARGGGGDRAAPRDASQLIGGSACAAREVSAHRSAAALRSMLPSCQASGRLQTPSAGHNRRPLVGKLCAANALVSTAAL